jgi:ribose 5-phosphate isomerase B
MRIAVGSDHAGHELKARLLAWLADRGFDHLDVGARSFDPEDDYPDFAAAAARAVSRGECDLGIVLCATGIGSCVVANKIAGIRAAVCHDTYSARYSRLDNDANVLCLGARVVGEGLALEIVATWLGESFSGEARHRRRIGKVIALDTEGKE